ncbi:MAG TPA: DUF2950 family protein [Methyloceanibacter sp.]|jgi:hypothetical protein|nr:DUF2950 family protein [Methyloceanibacter sp.]
MAQAYDAVIVGAGHNGLTCACYLARAGLRTLVLDQYHTDLAVASMPGGFEQARKERRTKAGETESPLGDIAAKASTEGYKFGGKPIPYHGYYYRILTRQGAGAPGGAYDYLVDNSLRGGFALIAYPSEYGNSGIMTFMINHDGTVLEKDLGPETGRLAPKIEAFLPDSTWSKAAP